MIPRKTPQEIVTMREGGEKLGKILQQLLKAAIPGVTLNSLNQQAEELIKQAGGTASFKTVERYHWATCLCVNEEVVHGIPSDYILKDNDLLTIDIGMLYRGLHTDTAWSKVVTNHSERVPAVLIEFLSAGERALGQAIVQAIAGNRIGHISDVIQQAIESAGYSVVRSLVGHGVGKQLHEEPQVPGILKGKTEDTPLLVSGMTLAIEIIYAQGNGAIIYKNDDGWTLSTRDRSPSAVFEHTVAITDNKPIVLTLSPD